MGNEIEYYCQLDLPQVPDRLLVLDFSSFEKPILLDYGAEHHRNGQKIFAPRYYSMPIQNKLLRLWLERTIPKELGITNMDQSMSVSTHPTQCEMIAHIDISRIGSLNYYIDTGGHGATITWYQEKGKSIQRSIRNYPDFMQTSDGNVDYDNLIELDSLEIKPNKWYWIRTDVIHGVKNLTGKRKFLSLYQHQTNCLI